MRWEWLARKVVVLMATSGTAVPSMPCPALQVNIVYFDVANTILDTEVQERLGMQSRWDEPCVGAPRVKQIGERWFCVSIFLQGASPLMHII